MHAAAHGSSAQGAYAGLIPVCSTYLFQRPDTSQQDGPRLHSKVPASALQMKLGRKGFTPVTAA